MNSPLRALTRRSLVLLAGILALAGAAAAPARAAAESAWVRTDQTAVRLISAVSRVGAEELLRVGLQMRLQPGWKTYWRSPGDAGFPLTIDWSGSTNLARADISWPVPHRFSLFGLETFGYDTEVVFPIAVRPERPGDPVSLRALARYLVCEQICIPYEAPLRLDLPPGPPTPTEHGQILSRFQSQVPGSGEAQALSLVRVAITGTSDAPVLEAVARSLLPFEAPDLIVEGPPLVFFGPPTVTLGADRREARLSVPVSRGANAPTLQDLPLTLTLVDGRRGLERRLIPSTAVQMTSVALDPALGPMLLLALLGGLLLNLMPCVLPVLSLKLLDVVAHGGRQRGAVRMSFLASAAGVLVSFMLLAGALAGLKRAGLAVGWGIQFQQPLFLVAMVLLLALFACNLWGWFEIRLPHWLGGAVVRGTEAGHGRGIAGHFLTGAFATLLATPCSAPFLGTAVGFALARGTGEIFAIFAALGLGLALPYLAIAALPGLATRLPKPGRWMMALRRALGAALAAAAAWLLTVLAAQLGDAPALLIAALVLAATALLATRRIVPGALRRATPAAVGLLAVVALLLPTQMTYAPAGGAAGGDRLWHRFDAGAIPALAAGGKLVFVDVTADWCITCQVNKTLVLNDPGIAERLRDPNVVAMRADWTRPDPAVAAYLASFGRYGIPFDAVYGPGAPGGIALPELLSTTLVREALDKAAAVRTAAQ